MHPLNRSHTGSVALACLQIIPARQASLQPTCTALPSVLCVFALIGTGLTLHTNPPKKQKQKVKVLEASVENLKFD